ncbi:MAG: hypothetical protein ATN36_08480 [Epulopiscium sp. Nele67-Bin005]|nr:MAG: hypothetical protein ATN36_08480 [Epulopiscium sp. Nele67-Bin005]
MNSSEEKFTEVVFGKVSSATLNDMVEIAQMMNLTNAMCLDGGASSGVFYNESVLSAAGRNLNNAIVFTEK